MGTMTVGQASAFAPNYNKAVIGAARIFKLLDRVPLIDSTGETGSDVPAKVEGNIEFDKAGFSYPSRPTVKVRELGNILAAYPTKYPMRVSPSAAIG